MAKRPIIALKGFSASGRVYEKGQPLQSGDFDRETVAALISMGRLGEAPEPEDDDDDPLPVDPLPGLPGAGGAIASAALDGKAKK